METVERQTSDGEVVEHPSSFVFAISHTAHRTSVVPFAGRLGSVGALVGRWDFGAVKARIADLEHVAGVDVRQLGDVEGEPVHRIRIPALNGEPKLRVLITGGVHGKEAAGVAGAMLAIDEILADPTRRQDVEYTVIPVVSPWGYINKKRNNPHNKNINRFFLDGPNVPEEVRIIRDTLNEGHYDLAVDLHAAKSAGSGGFFALHRGGLDLLEPAVARFRKKHPVFTGASKLYTQDSPGIYTSKNKGTLKDYMAERGTIWTYTIESPGKMRYERQVRGHAHMIRCLVDGARRATR